jgi:hypothetical protein
MSLGFIIIRHVNSKITDYYWKECYTCIRKFYDNPILIIDDSSNKTFLNENIFLKNCTVIYDTEHKGAAELLPYYYFHKLKPFDTAVIIHDSVFIQTKINFDLNTDENIRFLWNFNHSFNDEIFPLIRELISTVVQSIDILKFYNQKHKWIGSFGAMSVIRWSFLDKINEKHLLFSRLLHHIKNRKNRHALERVLPLIAYFNDNTIKPALFGDIHNFYNRYDISFSDYLTQDFSQYPIMKVWTGR